MKSNAALSALALLFACFGACAADKGQTMAFTVDSLPAQQLVMIYYDNCEKRGLVFDPGAGKVDELVTLKTPAMSCIDTKSVVLDVLARLGLAVESRGTFDVVKKVRLDDRDGWRELIYRPRFRDALELSELAMIAVRKGMFAHQRRGAAVQVEGTASEVPESGSNGASITSKHVDKLVFFGPADEVSAVNSLLARLDVPSPQVEIKAGIYEFQAEQGEGSAINAVLSLFKGRIGVNIDTPAQAGGAVRIAALGVDVALSLLDQDSRFRYVARPQVLAKDGEAVHFFAGDEVRVNGAVVLDRNGNPIQSKETLSAGVTLDATPMIRGEVVDLTLYQSVSNFVQGADGEPSVLKRDLRSRLVMQPGSVYIIGGLQSTRRTQGRQRMLGWQMGASSAANQTEVVLVLSVKPDPTSL